MKSIWQVGDSLPQFPALQGEIRTDVLIIGGGMAGILSAYLLHQAGVRYVLVEKERICSGTTQNTTAKISMQHGLNYQNIVKRHGIEMAQKYLRANQMAIEMYAKLCRDIDCDFVYKDNYVYSTDDARKLEDELSALLKIGYPAQFCENLPIPVTTVGAVKFPQQAQFHPLKFIAHICRDLHIHEHTFVREMIGKTAVTDKAKIHAEKVIVATHFPFLNKHGSYFLKLYQHRSYLLALANVPDVGGMYVDENHKGMTFRNAGDYLLLGGGGHRTGKPGGGWAELKQFARQHYPQAQIQYAWAAQDCMSLDGMPYIGQYSRNTPDLYTAAGFNKWGMTGAMTAAMLLCELVQGKRSEFADGFDPSRSILTPQLFINGFEAAKSLLTFSEKRCPHLGCALRWNAAEHSWDCACHGSRFAENGRVLDNPANGNMKKQRFDTNPPNSN